jgi:hypothetical protein
MPWITYVGPIDVIDVPLHQLGNVPRLVPVEVSDDVAADLLTQPEWTDAGESN